MEEKDREIWIGKNRIYLDEDNILYYTAFGEHDEKTAIEIMKASLRFANMVEGKVDVILDHNNAGKSSPTVRKIYKGTTEHEKFGKIAHWGGASGCQSAGILCDGNFAKKGNAFFQDERKGHCLVKGVRDVHR